MAPSSVAVPGLDPIGLLWHHVKRALAENGHPTATQIAALAASLGYRLPASTIRSWLHHHSIPSWPKFEALLIALGAEKDLDWRSLWVAAKEAPRRNQEVTAEVSALSDPTDLQSTESTSPGRMSARLRTATFLGALVLLALALLFATWRKVPATSTATSGDTSSTGSIVAAVMCAQIVEEPAAVYVGPYTSARPIKYKYRGDEVVLVRRPQSSPQWLAIRTPKDPPGFAWMQASDLKPISC